MKFLQPFWSGPAIALFLALALTAPAQEPAANADEKKTEVPSTQKNSPAVPADDAPAPDAPPPPAEPALSADEVALKAEAAKLEAETRREQADESRRRAEEMRADAERELDAARSRADAIRDRAEDIKRRAEEMKARTRARADQERNRHREMQARRTGDDVVNIFDNSFLPAGGKADNVVSVFGNATSEGEVVESVVSVFGNAQAKGRTGDAVVAVFGNVTVDAHVGTVVAIFGNVNLGPKAEVDEEVVCILGRVNKNPSAVVHHQVTSIGPSIALGQGLQTWVQECLLKGRPLAFKFELGWAWGIAFALLAFYAVLALIFRGGIETCTRTLETRPGTSLLTAICTVFLSPIVIVFLCVILIGLILVPFLGMGLLFASFFGKAVMLAWIGRRCIRTLGNGSLAHPAVGVLIGGAIMLVLYTIPFFGFLIYKLIGWLGLGVVVLTVFTGLRRERPATPYVVPAVVGAAGGGGVAVFGTPAAPLTGEVPNAATTAGVPAVPPVMAALTLPRAGFWIRLAALGVDIVLVWILTHTLTGLFPSFGSIHIKADFFPSLALYATLMWKLRGTTIGGIVCNLKVVRIDGREIDWGTAIVRALGCFLSLMIAGLGFIWVAVDDDRQSWHDKIAGTTVVHVPKGVSLL
jgi:uncharacterized RDD family membrane protein YckC